MKAHRRAVLGTMLAVASATASASVVFQTWNTNEGSTGNYNLTITDTGTQFDWNLTVSPWNAEALGLFIDFGAVTMTGTPVLTSINPAGQVSVHAVDTTSLDCGEGCNLNGLSSLPTYDDWEIVFRLGAQGFDGIQTFSWTTSDFGLSESAGWLVGIRAQQLCDPGETLPDGSCGGSDKAWGLGSLSSSGGGSSSSSSSGGPSSGSSGGPSGVPEPGSGVLVGLALGALGLTLRARQKKLAARA